MDVKKLISDFSIAEKIELYNCLYTDLSGKGIGGDTELAHVNSEEMVVLRAMGGAGTINPNTNLIQFLGGGSSSPPPAPAVQTSVQQSEFPTELKPFIKDIFGKAQAIQEQREEAGFQAFEGPLQARFDPAQTRAFEQIEQIPGATQPLFEEATTLAREATRSPTDPQEVASFMNPFLRNVTDIQKREAQRIGDVEEQQLAAQAAQAGAFGGSRAAVLEAERQRNLATQLGDIEARGLAASYQDAQTRLANQRAREAAGATQLASLGSAIPAQQLKELGALSGVGAARQTQAQRGIDLARQEFEAEEAFPLRTLQEFSSILRGFPIEPTRTTKEQQFSAAQPLSTQLLGVGTQALGALGAAGIKPFGQAGGMVKEMPVKAQSGGALSSLLEKTQDLDTSPVLGMKRGGSFMEQLLTGGLLSTDKAINMAKKLPAPVTSMLGGAGLPKLLNQMGSRAQAPAAPAAGPSQEEIDKQIDAMLRQRAAQGQQMASKGAGPAQVGSQVGQVRQAFKGGGGLRQMVQLPSNRVRFGKTAYQDASSPLVEDTRELYEEYIGGPQRRGAEVGRLMYERPGPLTYGSEYVFGTREGLEDIERQQAEYDKAINQITSIGATPAALADDGDGGIAAEVTQAEGGLEETPKPKAKKTPAPDKKKKDTKILMDPEQAGFMKIAEAERFIDKTPMINKQGNVTLGNMAKLLGTYTDYKKAEQAQKEKINAANIKKAAAARAARTADAELALKQGQLRTELGKPAVERIKALNSLFQAKSATLNDPATSQFLTEAQKTQLRTEIAQLEAQLQPLLALPSPALEALAEIQGISATKPLRKKAT